MSPEETTLSQFLSSKNISQHLVNKGPVLDLSAVNDVARILRRDCPMEDTIFKGWRTAQKTEDNLWPLDGTEAPEAAQARWNRLDENTCTTSHIPIFKRRKVAHGDAEEKLPIGHTRSLGGATANISCSIGTTTTMQSSSSFTHQKEGGFISAAARLEQDEQERQENRLAKETSKRQKRGLVSAGLGEPSLVATGNRLKATNRLNSQGTLLNFFGKKTGCPTWQNHMLKSATIADPEVMGNGGDRMGCRNHLKPLEQSMTARAQEAILIEKTDGASSRMPLTKIPYALGNHKLRPISNKSRPCLPAAEKDHPSKPYVFLSSSPPPVDCARERGERGNEDQPRGRIGACKAQPGPEVQNDNSCLRAAATFHTTSVAQAQAVRNIHKKTLGVRRSMAGWANQTNKGFSVPSKANAKG